MIGMKVALLLACLLTLNVAGGVKLPSNCSSTEYYDFLKYSCSICPNGLVRDPTRLGNCLCQAGAYKNRDVIGFAATNACIPASLNSTSAFLYDLLNGAPNGLSGAVKNCSSNAIPSTNRDACVPCPRGMVATNGQCTCPTGTTLINEVCSSNSTGSATTFQNYASLVANIGCSIDHQQQSCQMLLNMCASVGYSSSSTFTSLCSSLSGQAYFPKGYQLTPNTDQTQLYVSTQENVNTTTFMNKLNFYLIVYDKFGAQVDFKPLDRQLFLCDSTLGDSVKFQSFGNNMVKSCNVTITPTETYFYDMLLKTASGNYAIVPVSLTGSNGPFYRRFTLGPDVVSSGSTYPSVTLQFNYTPPLLTPYLVISSSSSPVTIKNNSQASATNLTVLVPFIIIEVLILIWWAYSIYRYVMYNPHEQIELNYCPRVVWNAMWLGIRCFALGNWIFLFGVSLVCFCFYKFQQTLFFTLPDPTDSASQLSYYQPFATLFYVTLAFSLASCMELVWRITKSEYFLIDWEKPGQAPAKFNINAELRKLKTSIWRKLFVVNELYELSVQRLYNVQFTLLLVGLFLQGLDWINLQLMIPSTTVTETTGTANIVLAYFIISFLYSGIAALQIFGRQLFRVWFPLPQEDFVDLCCISNISIFIFDETLHGYYIHGKNPIGKSEGSLQHIESVFQKESENNTRGRGLQENDEQATQTFQLVIPRIMRHEFNKIYMERMRGVLTQNQVMNSLISKPVPQLQMDDYEALDKQNQDMSNAFRLYLEQVKKSRNQIVSRSCWSQLLGCPPDEIFYQSLPVFFRDNSHKFTRAFLRGNEWFLITCEINLLNFWFIILKSSYQAIFLTWIFTKLILKFIHEWLMKRNLSSNTLVDDKFFL